MQMPNAAEVIERLARESERQKLEIKKLQERNKELEKELAALKAKQPIEG